MAEIHDPIPDGESMNWFDLTKILASKAAMRQNLAQRPIEEKFAMLDAMRDRALAMREANPQAFPCDPKDEPRWYRQK
jgi:hypothetical protein